MFLSTQLGLASLLLLCAFAVLPFAIGRFPLGWIAGVCAATLGFIASRRGSR